MKNHTDCITRGISLLAGLYLAAAMLFPGLGDAWGWFSEAGLIVKMLGVVIGCAIIYISIEALRDARKSCGLRNLTVHSPGGDSAISIGALEGVLRDRIAAQSDLRDVKIHLCGAADDKHPRCLITFKLKRRDDIPGRVDEIKELAREEFARLIPSERDLKIECRVDSILAEVAGEAKPAPREEFAGPVWPVSQDDEPGSESR